MSGQTPLLFAFTILVIVAAIALNNGLEQLTTMHPIFSSLVTSPSATIAKWEADGVYTRQEEGPWAGKSGKHAPNLAVCDGGWGMVEVEVLHPDEPDHHTEGKDSESGDLLGSSLTKSNRAVFHLAERMKETGGQRMRVVAYARCNKHGTWASEPVLASGRR
ncbi:hypothetical protein TeGR_g6371 [Tetraparma gracilis]|uniref:Uncharacterized protein n=1 Tax=Tetraparma gracilis TaxID=2962635 RepID=A0ABQ6MGZ3_9STRA|nr:hypothetical protein TeGR_g6371 [Tetraparma gracilis]